MLLYSFLCGIILSVVYEGIRLLKLICAPPEKHSYGVRKAFYHILTFLTDLVFVLLFALVAILLTYRVSGGIFRGMVYVGMLAGTALYYFTVGRLTIKISLGLAKFIKKATRMILKLIYKPLRAFFLLIFKLYALTIGKIIGKIVYNVKQKRSEKQAALEGVTETNVLAESREEKGYRKEGRISFGGKRES